MKTLTQIIVVPAFVAVVVSSIITTTFHSTSDQSHLALVDHEHSSEVSVDSIQWLRVDLWHRINFITQNWSERYTITTLIYTDDQIVSVGISRPIGVPQIDPIEAEEVKPIVKAIAESVLDEHEQFKSWTVDVHVL